MKTLLIVGLSIFTAAGIVDLVVGVSRPRMRLLPYFLGAAGSVCLLIVGVHAVTAASTRIDLGNALGFGSSALVADPLAGLFLTLTMGLAVAVSLGFASWARPDRRVRSRGLGATYALTLAAVAVIVLAGDAFLFLFAWEALTVAFYLLSGFERHRRGRARASVVTAAIGKSSGSLLLFGFLLLCARSGSFTLASWTSVGPGPLRDVAFVLLVLGFGAKVGLVPLQIWMPTGYAAAPGPARALMAAVAVNVGFYGFWRTLSLLGAPPLWLAIIVLLVASFTALLGVAHAAVQADLQRVIAYSSVENGGLILTGYGVALAGAAVHTTALVAVGLVAASLQMVAHAVAKGTLFLASGTIEAATGTSALDELRGVGRRLPWSGTAFGIGACTLAGLPPTVGFASEWFLLQALLQQFRLDGLAIRLAMAVAGALVALTAGFATVAFVRILGLSILGSAHSRRPGHQRLPDTGPAGKVGVGLLATGCLAIAALSPLEIRYLAQGLAPITAPDTVRAALKGPWVLQPVFSKFSILSPSWLWVAMPVLLLAVVGFTLVASRGSVLKVRTVPAWRSATGGVAGEDRYTAFGYANPTRRVLGSVLLTHAELQEIETAAEFDPNENEGAALAYRSDVVELVEMVIYQPLLRPLQALVRGMKRLQSGRLDAYIAYMLVVLIGVLAVVAAVS